MALAILGLVAGSAVLIACIVVLGHRLGRGRRVLRPPGQPCGITVDGGWVPASGADDCGGDGGGDGGGGGD